jgi:WD40 repeat protein
MENKKKNDFTVIYDEYDEDRPKRKHKIRPTPSIRRFLPIIAIFAATALIVVRVFTMQTDGGRRENVSLAAFDPGTPYPTPVPLQPTLVIPKRIDDMAWSPANNRLAVSIWDQGQSYLEIMDVPLRYTDNLVPERIISVTSQTQPVEGLAFNSFGTLVAASDGVTTRVWDANTGLRQWWLYGESPAFDLNGSMMAYSTFDDTSDNIIRLFDTENGLERGVLRGMPRTWSAAFSPDGQKLAVSDNNRLLMWNVNNTASPQWIQPVVEGQMRDIAFSADGSLLAVASNNHIIVFTLEGSELLSLQSPFGDVWGIAFSPDGTRLAAAVGDHASGMAQVWDVNSGVPILTLQGHRHRVTGIAYNADGTRLITSSYDGSIRLWDTVTGAELSTLQL